jgi:hypothetical protein
MKKLFIILLPLFISIGCKTTKKVQTDGKPKVIVPSLKKENIHTLTSKLRINKADFKWLSAHVSIDMQIDSEETSFSGNIRMRKDSLIWMSLSKLGIKGAQLLLTQDSAFEINYRDDSYFKSDYDYINGRIDNDVDYDMVQAVMLGSTMEFYNDTSKMKSYFDGSEYIISTIRKRKLKKVLFKNVHYHSKDDGQFIFLDPTDFHITHLQVKDFVNNRTFDAYYSDFQKVDSVMFPFHIRFEIKASKNIKVDFQYKKVLFQAQEEVPFIIPKKYERKEY